MAAAAQPQGRLGRLARDTRAPVAVARERHFSAAPLAARRAQASRLSRISAWHPLELGRIIYCHVLACAPAT